jgi:hypothetical protein
VFGVPGAVCSAFDIVDPFVVPGIGVDEEVPPAVEADDRLVPDAPLAADEAPELAPPPPAPPPPL